jgi:hypothetical protein
MACCGGTDCNSPLICNGTCQPKLGTGKSCGSNNVCSSGVCSNGVCCEGTCGANHQCGASGKCECTCAGGKTCVGNACACKSGTQDRNNTGTCSPCGGSGQECCGSKGLGGKCSGSKMTCAVFGGQEDGICEHCGGTGEACCNVSDGCDDRTQTYCKSLYTGHTGRCALCGVPGMANCM